jgi:hypothetical protein
MNSNVGTADLDGSAKLVNRTQTLGKLDIQGKTIRLLQVSGTNNPATKAAAKDHQQFVPYKAQGKVYLEFRGLETLWIFGTSIEWT